MNTEFFNALEMLEREKNIPREYMFEKVELALTAAFKKEMPGGNVRIHIDASKKDIKVLRQMEVVEVVEDSETQITLEQAHETSKRHKIGSIVEYEHKTKTFGRMAAQSAKQVIIQGIREAERGMMIKEYEEKHGDIITAVVEKVDPPTGNLILNTGTSYATLLKGEQLPGDNYDVDSHIKVLVSEVRKDPSGPRSPLVTLTRTHANFVRRLMELEIPEISSGVVTITNIAREPGSRTKVAVDSEHEGLDPVGACIGNRGVRITQITNELNGEKIDVIRHSDNPAEFVRAALAPAAINEVIIADERSCRVVVDADQLSLAIGREGQNARLAARLTGYKIDIKTTRFD